MNWRSLGDSNPCFRRERATSWAARRREPPRPDSRSGGRVQAVLAGSPKCRCGPVRAFIAGRLFFRRWTRQGGMKAAAAGGLRLTKLVPSAINAPSHLESVLISAAAAASR
jgi:hypothetical protein